MMKHFSGFPKALLSVCILFSGFASGKDGPAIPRPKMALCDAVRKVENYFASSFENDPQDEEFLKFKQECIVAAAEYNNVWQRDVIIDPTYFVKLDEWSWIVTLIHPEKNSRTWVFQCRNDGTIKLLGSSR